MASRYKNCPPRINTNARQRRPPGTARAATARNPCQPSTSGTQIAAQQGASRYGRSKMRPPSKMGPCPPKLQQPRSSSPPRPCPSPARSPRRCPEVNEFGALDLDDVDLDDVQPFSTMEQIQMEVPLEVGMELPSTRAMRMERERAVREPVRSYDPNDPSCNVLPSNFEMEAPPCPNRQSPEHRYIPKFQYETPPKYRNFKPSTRQCPPPRIIQPPAFQSVAIRASMEDLISMESIDLYQSPSPERPQASPREAEQTCQRNYENDLFDQAETYSDCLDDEQMNFEDIMEPDEDEAYNFMSELRSFPTKRRINCNVNLDERRAANIRTRQTTRFPKVHPKLRGKMTRRCYSQRPNVSPIKEYYDGPLEPIYNSPRRKVPPIYPSVFSPPSAGNNYTVFPEAHRFESRRRPMQPTCGRQPLNRSRIQPRKLNFDGECSTEDVSQYPAYIEEQLRAEEKAFRNRPRPRDLISFKLGEYDFHISPPKPCILDEDIPQEGLPKPLIQPNLRGWKSPPNMPTRRPPSPPKPTVIKIIPQNLINILDYEEFPYADLPPKVDPWIPTLTTEAAHFIDELGTEGEGFLCDDDMLMDEQMDFPAECTTSPGRRSRSPSPRRSPQRSPRNIPLDGSGPITIRVDNGQVSIESSSPRNRNRSCSPRSPDTLEFEALERLMNSPDRARSPDTLEFEALERLMKSPDRTRSPDTLEFEALERRMNRNSPCRQRTLSPKQRVPSPRQIPRPTGISRSGGVSCIPRSGGIPRPSGIPGPGAISRPSGIPCPGGSSRPTGIPRPGGSRPCPGTSGIPRPGVGSRPTGIPCPGAQSRQAGIPRPESTSRCKQAGGEPANMKISISPGRAQTARQIAQCKTGNVPRTSRVASKAPRGSGRLARGKGKSCKGKTPARADSSNTQATSSEIQIDVNVESAPESEAESISVQASVQMQPLQETRTPPRVAQRRLILQRKLFDTYNELHDLDCGNAEDRYNQEGLSPLSQPLSLYKFRENVRMHEKNARRRRGKQRRVSQDAYRSPIYEDPREEMMDGQCYQVEEPCSSREY